jgi:hypothetical protein
MESQKPIVDLNSKLLQSNNIKTNAEYRKYMIAKADVIRERNTKKYA